MALAPFIVNSTTTQTVVVVVNPRVGGFAYVLRLCGPFKQSLLKIWQLLQPPQALWFLDLGVMGIYLPGTGTLCWAVWAGSGITYAQGFPPNFYPTYWNVGQHVPPLQPPLHVTLSLWSSDPSG